MKTLYVVGLGNPGVKYATTRHNIGKIFVKRWAEEKQIVFKKQGPNYIGMYEDVDIRVVVAYPDVYMNHSGRAVETLLGGKIDQADNLLVLVDDLETRLGLCKLAFDGGARGHNGLRSIHKELGTKTFFQLRIGIGRPESDRDDIADYVLSNMNTQEKAVVDSLSDEVFRILGQWIESRKGS